MSSPTTDISLLVPVCIDLRIALYKLCYGNIKVIIIIIIYIFIHDNVLFIGTEKTVNHGSAGRKLQSPGEIKWRGVSWTLAKKLRLFRGSRQDQEEGGGAGPKS